MTYRSLKGGLGNQMFQIAATIGLAVREDKRYGFPPWKYQKFFTNPLPILPASRGHQYDDNKGYLQDFRYFEHCEELIRYYFALKPLTEPLRDKVFIHFRAYGDEGVERKHPEMPRRYYQEAVKLFPKSDFIVFTDNKDKARKVIGIDCEYRTGNEMEDFYQMTTCAGGIISNSTFAWWAGWLTGSGRMIVAPSYWFTGEAAGRDTSGLYPNHWRVL